MKKFVVILVLAIAFLGLAGCTQNEPSGEARKTFQTMQSQIDCGSENDCHDHGKMSCANYAGCNWDDGQGICCSTPE